MENSFSVAPSICRGASFLTDLGAPYRLDPGARLKVRIRYLDTFDWRLHDAGWILEELTSDAETRLRLRHARTGEHLESTPLAAPLGGLDELPRGGLRRIVGPIAGKRALATTGERRCEARTTVVRDGRDKIVLRLEMQCAGHGAGAAASSRACRLELYPMRGYDDVAALARQSLRDQGAVPARCEAAHEVWKAGPRTPWTRPSLARSGVGAGDTAGEAVSAVLGVLLRTMRENEAGVLAATDTEFLHDFRVAIRRARSMLRDLPSVLDPALEERLEERLGEVGRVGGEVRDLDVQLEDMPSLVGDLDPAVAAAATGYLETERVRRRAVLTELLESSRYRRLLADLERVVSRTDSGDRGPEDGVPVTALLLKRFAKLHRRVLKEGRGIKGATPNAQLHALRKRCKRLRYLLDLCVPLYPDPPRARMVKALKSIQDDLGRFQDCEAQLHNLQLVRAGLAAAGGEDAATHATLDRLAARIRERQRGHAKAFRASFRRFDSAKRHRDVEALFSDGSHAEAPR